MNSVCGKCGDSGYPEILVCCLMCQDAYEHRYCFNKASDIFREGVKWVCEDCLLTIPKKSTPKKISNLPSRRSKRISSRTIPAGELSPPDSKRTKPRSESSDETEHSEQPSIEASTECNQRTNCILQKNENKGIQSPSETEGKAVELIKESLSNAEEIKDTLGGTIWIDLPGPGSHKVDDHQPFVPLQIHNSPAQPITEPVWKGSFRVCYKKLSKKVKSLTLAAHLSTLACPKAQKEAKLLPAVLQTCIVPRSLVWPKSFQMVEPKDESIGLYFFADMDSEGEGDTFDSLVDGMISEDLAMVCRVENAELLLFTSMKLPFDCWRFQGKRYLWGVFRAKQTLPNS